MKSYSPNSPFFQASGSSLSSDISTSKKTRRFQSSLYPTRATRRPAAWSCAHEEVTRNHGYPDPRDGRKTALRLRQKSVHSVTRHHKWEYNLTWVWIGLSVEIIPFMSKMFARVASLPPYFCLSLPSKIFWHINSNSHFSCIIPLKILLLRIGGLGRSMVNCELFWNPSWFSQRTPRAKDLHPKSSSVVFNKHAHWTFRARNP